MPFGRNRDAESSDVAPPCWTKNVREALECALGPRTSNRARRSDEQRGAHRCLDVARAVGSEQVCHDLANALEPLVHAGGPKCLGRFVASSEVPRLPRDHADFTRLDNLSLLLRSDDSPFTEETFEVLRSRESGPIATLVDVLLPDGDQVTARRTVAAVAATAPVLVGLLHDQVTSDLWC